MSFVGPKHTSQDWQLHETNIAVWAIGALEQHGHHLPLDADTFQAEHFAGYVAEQLQAALLPSLPYGTSMEHKGFRGTISLKPQLLMDMLRNMADELEQQSFTRLIVVNGHGGNFALFPCIREINRMDRGIKIVAVNPWEFRTSTSAQPEVHAGEMETSIMLALEADVGEERIDSDPFVVGFQQSDLNTFGVGRLSHAGVWGHPTRASKAKGKRLLNQIYKGMMQHLRSVLKQLDQDARYGGPGPVAIRTMSEDDLPFGLQLSRVAGWNQLAADWELYFKASDGYSFIAMHNGKKAGTVTTINYNNKLSWIGMVLVDPAIRRAGVGTALLTKAIESCEGRGAIMLDATPEGRNLYLTLGFEDDCRLSRMRVRSPSTQLLDAPLKCTPMRPAQLNQVIEYDGKIFGTKRQVVIRHLFEEHKRYAFVYKQAGQICGFCLGRSGYDSEQIGPIMANNEEIAQSLLISALKVSKKKNVIIDCLDDQDDFYQILESLGFEQERPLIRMFKGQRPKSVNMLKQYAISGPELG